MSIRCCHNPRSSYYCLIERSWDHNEKIKKNSTVLSSARASSTASYFRPSTGLNRKELFGTFNRLILLQADDRYIMGGAWGEGHMRRRRGSVLGLPGRRRRRQRSRRRCCNAASHGAARKNERFEIPEIEASLLVQLSSLTVPPWYPVINKPIFTS